MNELFEPVPNILSRRIENESLRERLSHYANALDELISISTHLLSWEFKDDFDETNTAYNASGDEIVIIGVAFKRILELMDAIAIQVRHGAIVTATVHLRVLFELAVQLEHLLSEDSHRRCQCILVADWYRDLEFISKIPVNNRTEEEVIFINELNTFINRQELNDIKAEYDLVRNKYPKIEIKWYRLFDPKLSTFNDLINKKFPKYKVHYRFINKGFGNDAVHSTNLIRNNLSQIDGLPAIIQMRNPTEALGLAGIAFSIGKTCCEFYKERRSKEKKSQYVKAIMNCEKRHKEVAFAGLYKMNISK